LKSRIVDLLVLSIPLVLLLVVVAAMVRRRVELAHRGNTLAERAKARELGSHRARLQHPKIDLANCIGCGACVRACPEDGVLALAYGQAVVVHGARCVGHGLCAAACPTNAIALTLGDLQDRRDLPAISNQHEAVGVPGLFLAGEITGFALVRTAVAHGALVAEAVGARVAAEPTPAADRGEILDLLVIGLGPAGLACLLGAKQHGLRALGVDQAAELGGTVAAYPRRKLVMTQPMALPLHGKLGRLEYEKEELVALWQGLAQKHALPTRTGVVVQGVERDGHGGFVVATSRGKLRARNVCMAVGRRGSPQKLGVPGEDLPKVAYSLLDAESYTQRAILVVGGGDSAIEAALALAEQPGNSVVLSYRKATFSRLKARNQERIDAAVQQGTVRVLFETVVAAIERDSVRLQPVGKTAPHAARQEGPQDADGGGVATALIDVPNDEVFIFAGGTPPFPLLEAAGVSFDPAMRPPEEVQTDRGTGLLVALASTAFGLLGFLLLRHLYASYYDLPVALRSGSDLHPVLRPQGWLGLFSGVLATALFAANLAYLLRRAPKLGRLLPGSLKAWMNVHVATGLAAALLALLHSGFALRPSPGGHALLCMLVVVAAGVVGRWFYAFVPHAQNGRQQDLEELGHQVAAIAGEWDQHGRGFGAEVRRQVEELVEKARLGRGFFERVLGLVRSQWRLRRQLSHLRAVAVHEGVPSAEVARLVELARRSHRLAMQLTHYEEVRGVLALWRWIHRWLALLLLLLTVVHVVTAMRYGGVDFGVLFGGTR
jgi:thioredoxin reductase